MPGNRDQPPPTSSGAAHRRHRRSTLRLRPRTGLILLIVGTVVASLLGWAHTSGRHRTATAIGPAGSGRSARAGSVGPGTHPSAPAPTAPPTTAAPTTLPPTTVPPTTAPPTTVPPTTTTTGPGSLPQTAEVPTTATAQFGAEMAALWSGVVTGSATPAMSAFFPEAAYAQLKAIGSPQYDWSSRLVSNFSLDLMAAHALLGGVPSSAVLVGVQVPDQYAHWVPPGDCYNSVGYYEVPDARVVYQEGGQTRSFGIASMISWRGEWYVVHLGAVESYASSEGVVDDPEPGPGTSVETGPC